MLEKKNEILRFFSNYFCKAVNISVACILSSVLFAFLWRGRAPNTKETLSIFLGIFKQVLIFKIWGYEKGETCWKTLFSRSVSAVQAYNKIYPLVLQFPISRCRGFNQAIKMHEIWAIALGSSWLKLVEFANSSNKPIWKLPRN